MTGQEGRNPKSRTEDSPTVDSPSETAERSPASVLGLAKEPAARRFSVDLPYDQRQSIVVVPNQVVAIESSALQGLRRKADAADRTEAVMAALGEFSLAGSQSLHAVEGAVRGVMRARAAGFDVVMVAASDAADQVSWAPGHPFEGVVYVGHPGVPGLYYSVAEFHQRVFEHKFCEAIDLVMSLGASSVKVDRREGFGVAEAGAMNLAFTPRKQSDAERQGLGHARGVFEADFPGSDDPEMPEQTVWMQSEPSWQTLAKARIRYRTEAFSLTVRYENDYGINQTLVSALASAGLGTGGRFHAQLDTVWEVEAQFPSARATGNA